MNRQLLLGILLLTLGFDGRWYTKNHTPKGVSLPTARIATPQP